MPIDGPLPLSRSAVDRDHAARARPELLDELWADPGTRVLVVRRGESLRGAPDRLAFLAPHALPRPALSVYLGRTTEDALDFPAGTRIVAALIDDDLGTAGTEGDWTEGDWVSLRQVGHELAPRDAGLLTQALAVLNWHAVHAFSPRSGEATVVEAAGWVRRDSLGAQVFPRTDPAIIVAVLDADDRILLGANARWEPRRYSLLAGFVDPGESLEAAVIREVHEESGLRVVDPVYLGSQPWPFPASLMLGFVARLAPDDPGVPTPDGEEIVDLRWFTHDDFAGESRPTVPPPTSIARAILDAWLKGGLADRLGAP